MRWNIPRDASNWCADDQGVYVAAQSEAWLIDGGSGEIRKHFPVPKVAIDPTRAPQSKEHSWGYIARHQDLLLGTAVQSDATYVIWWGKTQWFDSPTGADTHAVAGDAMFALDPKNRGNCDGPTRD